MSLLKNAFLIFVVILAQTGYSFAGKTIICGSVENSLIDEITIARNNYYDLSGGNIPLETVVFRKNDSTFRMEVEIDEPEKLSLRSGEFPLIAPLYLDEGDSLYIKMKFTDRDFSYDFSGSGESVEANRFAKAFNDRFTITQEFAADYREISKTGNYDTFLILINNRWQVQANYLDSLEDEAADYVIEDLKTRINYDWANSCLWGISKKNELHFQENKKNYDFHGDMAKIFEKVELDNAEAASVPAYVSTVYSYLSLLFFEWIYEQQATGAMPEQMDSYKKIFEIAEKHFEGCAYDIGFSRIIMDFGQEISTREQYNYTKAQIEKFKDEADNIEYYKQIKKFFATISLLIPGSPAPDFTLTDINGKKVSLSDFKGKVVYIDFWGTWCGPCRRELPHYKALQEKFTGNDDVVFMSVAMERGGRDQWSNFVKSKSMPGVQLYSNRSEDNVGNLYKINAVPTFMLIDKEGVFVYTKAKRPSDPTIENEIKKLLK